MQGLRKSKVENTKHCYEGLLSSAKKGPSVGKSLVPGEDWVVGWTGQRSGGVHLSLF